LLILPPSGIILEGMKQFLKIIFLFLIVLSPLRAQNFGIAVEDQVLSALINPAAMGVGNSGGFAYINRYSTDQGFLNDYDLLFSLGNLAYSYGNFYGTDKHLIASGFRLAPGSYGGISYQWYKDSTEQKGGGLGLSFMIRPSNSISLAVKGVDLNNQASTELGFGFRPLFFSKKLASRFTLSGDARIEDSQWQEVSLGAFVEPTDGVKIFSDYNFEKEVFQLGVRLSFSYLEVGSAMDASGDRAWKDGTFQALSSFKKQRSLMEHSLHKAIEYDLAGVILDAPTGRYSSEFPRKELRSLADFILDMEKIKKDTTAKAIIFKNQEFKTNFANLLEIEEILKEVKESGKKIYFYYDSIDNLPYSLVASVADELYLNPAGSVFLQGFSVTNFYLKDFFDQWGIKVHNFRSHEYKTAYNSFSESGMTDEEREALQYLYDGLHTEMIRMIKEGRGSRLTDTAQSLIDRGPFIHASQALAMGLVDRLTYEDEFDAVMKERKLNVFKASLSTGNMDYDWDEAGQPVIAVIYAIGGITRGEGTAGSSIGSDSMVRAIRNARRNPLVKGIILRVNSEGGSSLASDLIAREVALCRMGEHPKPVVVSMGGAAASGGYYMAVPASRIIASPASITGSIGVITILPEISGLMEKIGIAVDTVKTAENAETGNILKPLTRDEEEQIREYIAAIYDQFITLVSEYRELSIEEVDESARGRIWTGTQARERGLVDINGGLTTAFGVMKELIQTENELRLIEIVPGRNPGFLERMVTEPFLGRIKTESPLPEDLKNLMMMYQSLSEYEEGEALYLMPYTAEELGVSP
jgi:protease-4